MRWNNVTGWYAYSLQETVGLCYSEESVDIMSVLMRVVTKFLSCLNERKCSNALGLSKPEAIDNLSKTAAKQFSSDTSSKEV